MHWKNRLPDSIWKLFNPGLALLAGAQNPLKAATLLPSSFPFHASELMKANISKTTKNKRSKKAAEVTPAATLSASYDKIR